MSLLVALHLDDYVIIANDKRGHYGYAENGQTLWRRWSDEYIKLKEIPFGHFASAGEHQLVRLFYFEAMRQPQTQYTLEQLLRVVHEQYCNLHGYIRFKEKTTIVLIAKATQIIDGGKVVDLEDTRDSVLEITFEKNCILIEKMKPMSLVAAMANENPDPLFWAKLGPELRHIDTFSTFEHFFNYHADLIRFIWEEHLRHDPEVSHHIDFHFHNRVTSKGVSFAAEQIHTIPKKLLDQLDNQPTLARSKTSFLADFFSEFKP